MLGIMNELAKTGQADITLISNIKDRSRLHDNIKAVALDLEFKPDDKRKFQFLLGAFGLKAVNRMFRKHLNTLSSVFYGLDADSRFVFFEYLDNSIGYWLNSNAIIPGYVNDIHGIATHEFAFQAKMAQSLKAKVMFSVKEKVSAQLDARVFNNATAIFYASKAMQDYFYERYPLLQHKKNIYLPYVLNENNVGPADGEVIQKFKTELEITDVDFVFLFAGAFKEITGIQDLITAFDRIASRHPNARLLLVGDGPTFKSCYNLKEAQEHGDRIHFLGRQPYRDLSSFQELSHVLVCPDRQNLFSDLIVHVKYLDALSSGKLVINGRFKSVMEINETKELSLLFTPSDIDDLVKQMEKAICNYYELSDYYSSSKNYTLQHLTYNAYIHNLLN